MADAVVHSFTQSPFFYFLSFHNLDPIIYTSVNPVHNAPVEKKKKKKSPGSLTDTENKIHQKKKKEKEKKVRAV